MKNLEQLKKIIENCKPTLKKKFGVKNIGIFGSYTQNQMDKDSDIDILVEFSRPVGFFTFLKLEEFLEQKLGTKVDLVTKKALKPAIGRRILKEVSYI